jgi:hypothetical protein
MKKIGIVICLLLTTSLAFAVDNRIPAVGFDPNVDMNIGLSRTDHTETVGQATALGFYCEACHALEITNRGNLGLTYLSIGDFSNKSLAPQSRAAFFPGSNNSQDADLPSDLPTPKVDVQK